MNRNEILQQLESVDEWDIIIIGGGATGLGAVLDGASRGYKVLLLEQFDFAKGTSSRSTKLIHGGVRYLEQGNIKLVFEALRERGRLLKNAPHITSSVAFILPVYSYWQKFYYGFGLMLYDLLSGKLSLGQTKLLSKKKVIESIPSIQSKKLKGGILYHDGQFDDSRLAIDIASTAAQHGASVLNYFKVIGFEKKRVPKNQQKIIAVKATDQLTNKEYSLKCKVVINATGVFTDEVMQMDEHEKHNIVSPSQGIHLVIDKKFFEGENALIIPKTSDGRVLFAVPWHHKVVVGTTDTPMKKISIEPIALEEEIQFIISHFNRYCKTIIERKDVKAVYAGLRPLVKINRGGNTSLLSRDHTIIVSKSGLVNTTGGKWTTYRKMAQDAIDNAVFVSKLAKRNCVTSTLPIGDWNLPIDKNDYWHTYGNNKIEIQSLMNENNSWKEKIHSSFEYTKAEVIWFVRKEMANCVEDVLARRTRMLFLDANAAIESAPLVAEMMMNELSKDENWKQQQIELFMELAKKYSLQ
jgi:glycerol-3-phosphate dehydrogenase